MLLLVSVAHPTHMRERHPHLGRLVIPRDCARVDETAAAGISWAADNFAFAGFDADGYRRMLQVIAGVPRCLFLTVPDVVGDAAATLERFGEWRAECSAVGQPLGFVAQDGIDLGDVPWGELGALFIGGTDAFKLGPLAERAVNEAHRRGLWVHMGRVNTAQRARYAATIGVDSIDGTQFSRWRTIWLRTGLAWVQAPPQLRLAT